MTCKKCAFPIQENFYFCPNCGNKIQEPPFKFSPGRAIYILFLSIILPPFGIVPSIKYIIAPDPKAKMVGIIGLILNITILVLATVYLINIINKSVDQVNLLTNPQGSIEQQVQTIQSSQ